MGVGLVRSLQPPDILWIHWRVYNSIAKTSKGDTLLPPSDACVRSFLYLLYTLINTHTHTRNTGAFQEVQLVVHDPKISLEISGKRFFY